MQAMGVSEAAGNPRAVQTKKLLTGETPIRTNIGAIAAVVIVLASGMWSYISLNFSVSANSERISEVLATLDEHQVKLNSNDVQLAEIRTQLSHIEELVLEIRASLKDTKSGVAKD